jgi:hypothetical protein
MLLHTKEEAKFIHSMYSFVHTLAVPEEVVDPHLIGLSNASGPVTADMQPAHGGISY